MPQIIDVTAGAAPVNRGGKQKTAMRGRDTPGGSSEHRSATIFGRLPIMLNHRRLRQRGRLAPRGD